MLSMNTNEIIIDKHSSSVQISNKISVVQRKSYNYMLKIAKNEFKKNKQLRVFTLTAEELLIFFEMGGENHTHLKQELETLNRTMVIYNFLGKDRKSKRWGSFTLIAGFEYDNGVITYSFPHQIIDMLLEPKMFAKINLVAIKGLRSRYSIALYELAEDYINAQIPKMKIEDFRVLMGIGSDKYSKFSMFKKRVIDIAVEEINMSEHITFTLSYELEKTSRKITHIKFKVHKKKDTLQLKDKQKNFYAWKNILIEKYRGQNLCNNLKELNYLKWTIFFITQEGYLGREVEGNRSILETEEAMTIWEFLHQNPSKIAFEELTHLDMLIKDFKHKKIQQKVKTAFETESTVVFEFLDFITDDKKEDSFFIKLKEENDNTVITQKSFSFEEIVGMNFV